jgi:hypothetical protein
VLLDLEEPPRVKNGTVKYVPGYEDMRLIEWKENIYGVVNARSCDMLGRARMYLIFICSIDTLDSLETVHKCRAVQLIGPTNSSKDEKNWAPFVYQDRLLLNYSIVPHVVYEVENLIGDTIKCTLLSISDTKRDSIKLPDGNTPSIEDLRCGTQCIPFKGSYLGVGHFRSYEEYYSILYSFSSAPPFKLRSIGTPFKLGKHNKIEYISGIRYKEGDEKVYLTYGVDDCYGMEVGVSVEAVLKMLGTGK